MFSPMQRLDGRIVNPKVLPQGILSVRLHTEPIQSETRECGTFMTLRLLYDATDAQGSLDERLAKLGFLRDQQKTLIDLTRREGLCVISGATGHGKSTLLKHIFEAMVRDAPGRSYLSVEDPPEYILQGVEQIQVVTQGSVRGEERRERYREALAGALRSDPDVLMIGEIRYAEACATAVAAALTGHSVWATLHANDVFGIVRRMEALLAETGVLDPRPRLLEPGVLSGLIHQRLVPVLCPACKKPFKTMKKKDPELFERVASVLPPDSVSVRGKGCARCGGRGCVSMTLCAEVLTISPHVHDALLMGDGTEARALWKKEGGMTCLEVALRKCGQGLLDPKDIERRLSCPVTG
ncbi:MAG: Flp pilus assembly complex ATPase component TadA [Desulfovibrionaceae bacterium]|nr:Flp pilus assembly complex ATPase component TadA [Desulfovibrionaceae bacterium]